MQQRSSIARSVVVGIIALVLGVAGAYLYLMEGTNNDGPGPRLLAFTTWLNSLQGSK